MVNTDSLCINCMMDMGSANAQVCPRCGFQRMTYIPKPHHLAPMTILHGRYLLGRVLGEGGFGITYAAYDLKAQTRVAIKELFVMGLVKRENTRTVLVDGSFNQVNYYKECKFKFKQESELLLRMLNKEGVVDIRDFFEENNTGYIVMEFLEGNDIIDILKMNGGTISFTQTFWLLKPVMKSLMEMHTLGIYHRDISPDNIRRLANGKVKLMDLGGAKYTVSPSQSQYISLKHGYAPPEQYASGYKIGPWMDVYAMAATFYRCITGRIPPASIDRVTQDTIQWPRRDLGINISSQAEAVLMKGLALQTEQRYMDIRQFYEALKQLPDIKDTTGTDSIGNNNAGSKDTASPDDAYSRKINEINREHGNDKKKMFSVVAVVVVVLILLFIIVPLAV